ncbi:hypothetical protein JZ751_003758 [Albula glossodonta]|uniref:Uncharacterized protein n=1 Tax=Albula glossodonta TaxID=121402 RepID=A0A8T2P5D8_9TELE|nr:hypothetical protein JZ751_003758 [Albula glossodonta]
MWQPSCSQTCLVWSSDLGKKGDYLSYTSVDTVLTRHQRRWESGRQQHSTHKDPLSCSMYGDPTRQARTPGVLCKR